jgi:[ribosomal protein S18]-alanine N-acetyltransferase
MALSRHWNNLASTCSRMNNREKTVRAQYHIRRVAGSDLKRIAEIEETSFGAEAYDVELFAAYLRTCGGLFLLAECAGKIHGYLLCCFRTPSAELISVAVAPEFRCRGVASALLESLLRRLRRRGAARLHLVVRVTNRAAQAFYAKYQFRRLRTAPGYYEDGGDGISMSRPVRL